MTKPRPYVGFLSRFQPVKAVKLCMIEVLVLLSGVEM